MDYIGIGEECLMNKKVSRYIRIPDEIKYAAVGRKPFSDILVGSIGFRYGHDKGIGYDVQRVTDEYLLKYCIFGCGWFEADGLEYKVMPGDIIICPKHLIHRYRADHQEPWSVYWSYFSGDCAEIYYDWIYSSCRQYVFHLGLNSSIEKLFQDMYATLERGYAPHYMLHSSNLLKHLLSLLISEIDLHHLNNRKEVEIDSVVQIMMDNLDKKIRLSDLASKYSISRDHFIHLFQKKYGYTPMDYFIRMKVQKACELLVTTNKSIFEISASLGFSDQYYFSRLFKKKVGISPRTYRHTYV